MSAQAPVRRVTAPQIADRKGAAPIVALTAYTAPMAAMVDAHADVILVGDSLGMVVHGLPSTIGVTYCWICSSLAHSSSMFAAASDRNG